ncbi:MAG: acyltransferase [Gallionella sp.]
MHIGPGCRLDLAGSLAIGARSTLSPGVTILTHSDPGESHGSRLTASYPPCTAGVFIGADCWLGANATILSGVKINELAVVGAGSVVTKEVPGGYVVAGNPARTKKPINSGDPTVRASPEHE